MKGIVWLASYPKSGNTWVRILLSNLLRGSDAPVSINALDPTPIASARHMFDDRLGIAASDLTPREIARLMTQQNAQTPWVIGAMILGALAASKSPDAASALFTGTGQSWNSVRVLLLAAALLALPQVFGQGYYLARPASVDTLTPPQRYAAGGPRPFRPGGSVLARRPSSPPGRRVPRSSSGP